MENILKIKSVTDFQQHLSVITVGGLVQWKIAYTNQYKVYIAYKEKNST